MTKKVNKFIVFSVMIMFFFCPPYCLGLEKEKVITKKTFGGEYSYGAVGGESAVGVLTVYPLSKGYCIFHLEVNRGKPSYNSGELRGKIKITRDGKASYSVKDSKYDINCILSFSFQADKVIIVTDPNACKCSFGYGVSADGEFNKTSSKIPESYIDRHGKTIFFKNLIKEMAHK